MIYFHLNSPFNEYNMLKKVLIIVKSVDYSKFNYTFV